MNMNLFRSSIVKDASILTLGTTIAQFFPMLIYPFLGRMYSPGQFAALASFTSLVTIFQVVGSGKYETAILVADSDKDAANLFSLTCFLCFIFAIGFYFVLLFFGAAFTYPYTSGLDNLIWILPLGFIFYNIFCCYNEWCVRKQYFKKLSLNKITNSLSIAFGKLGAAFTSIQTIGLTFGDFLGRVFTAFVCAVRLYYIDKESFKHISFREMKKMALLYIEYPKYTMPAQLLNTVATAAPIFILNKYFDSEIVGYYSMTMSVLLLPINVISLSVRDVFRKKANDVYKNTGHFESLYKRVFVLFAVITAIVCILCFPILPSLFVLVLGNQWQTAGEYSQILLPMIAFDFIAMSLSGVFQVTQKLSSLFVWQLSFCISTILTVVIPPAMRCSIETTLTIFSIGRVCVYTYMLIVMYRYSKGSCFLK